MKTLRPKMFIGSSTPGIPIAEQVKDAFSKYADCTIWNETGVWEPNRSTFDNLMGMVNYFDFGVFVATADDLTLKGGKMIIEARDNVILEMTLFLGGLGRDKSFLLVEKGTDLPTDFNGIYQPRFVKGDSDSINKACAELYEKVEEYYKTGHLSLYPTTALAIAYYKNFVAGIVEAAQNPEPNTIDDVKFTDFKLKVVVPNDLHGNIREKADLFYKKHGLTGGQLNNTKFRPYPTWFQYDKANAPTAIMYDMPSTLTGVDEAISLILRKGHTGRTKLQEIIEQRELNNFKRVLQIQIDASPYAKKVVEIVDEF